VNATIIERLLAQELIPVVATIGSDESGQSYNINADTAAAAVAEALQAEKLVYLTNVEGLRRRLDDPASLVHTTDAEDLEAMMAEGILSDGMIPKAAACVRAVRAGVRQAHILDGRLPHALLLEVYTREGIGTLVSQ
jgi:acetylglutamate kinase